MKIDMKGGFAAITRSAFLFMGLFLLMLSLPASASMLRFDPNWNADQSSEEPSGLFKDLVASQPNHEAIAYLKNQNVIAGYADGNFKPDTTINRAEFIKIVVAAQYSAEVNMESRSAGQVSPALAGPDSLRSSVGENCFSDVKNDWFAKYVCTAKAKGLIQGYADGTFRPGQNINLVEASKIVAKAFNIPSPRVGQGPWYKPYIEALSAKKAIPVSIDYAAKKLTRAEMAEMMWRLKTNHEAKSTKNYAALTEEFPALNSCAELEEKVRVYSYQQNRKQLFMPRAMMMEAEGVAESAATADSGASRATQQATDYSETNVQIAGVDEADVIKNDGAFIYILKGKSVRIVKAYPANEMTEIARLTFDDPNFYPSNLYLNGETLVVVGSTSPSVDTQENDLVFRPYQPLTRVSVYDIADRSNPQLKRTLTFEGSEVSSRRIGNQLYLVLNDFLYSYGLPQPLEGENLVPHMYEDKLLEPDQSTPLVPCEDIRFFPRHFEPTNYLIILGVPLDDANGAIEKEVFMGSSATTVYASLENIFVTSPVYEYDETIRYEMWGAPVMNTSTAVHRFKISGGNIDYKGKGQVPGTILNQFSLDEHDGAFRVATTEGETWNGNSKNHLYLLDVNDLSKVLGKIENIAPGERIYSVRFMGDRAYLVTFKKIDPFFVIDVADPANPKILGALKIPGFSDYLHPYDENHIIGIGKDTVEPEEGERFGSGFDFAWYQGMKIALFDVTDVANPKQQFLELIGDRGTDSEVLYNHKAFLFDKEKGLLAFPVTVMEIPNKEKGQYTGSHYGQWVFQGAYVYHLDLENGFQLKGKITHIENPEVYQGEGYYWQNYQDTIQRILYIAENLYTVSQRTVKATDRESFEEKAKLTLEPQPDEENNVIIPIY